MVQLLGILRCTHLNIPTLNTVRCIKETMDTCWPMEYLLHCSFQFTLAYKDRMTLKQRFLLLIYCRTHQIPFFMCSCIFSCQASSMLSPYSSHSKRNCSNFFSLGAMILALPRYRWWAWPWNYFMTMSKAQRMQYRFQ